MCRLAKRGITRHAGASGLVVMGSVWGCPQSVGGGCGGTGTANMWGCTGIGTKAFAGGSNELANADIALIGFCTVS